MTRPQVASRSEVARGLRASVCAAKPRRGSLLYNYASHCRIRFGAILVAAIFAMATTPLLADMMRVRHLSDTYLKSDGTQFIDTGLYPTTNMAFEVEFEPEIDGTVRYLFGSYGDGSTMAYGLFMQNRTICFVHGTRTSTGWSNTKDGGAITAPARYKVTYSLADRSILMYSGDSWQFNNWGVKLNDPGIATNNCSLGLFGNHKTPTMAGDLFKGKLYSFRVLDKGVLVRDFVPYGRESVTGMLDRCSGKVFVNNRSGGNPFVLGTDDGYVRSYRTCRDGQFISTGVNMTPLTKIEIDFSMEDFMTAGQVIFGAGAGAGLPCGFRIDGDKKFSWGLADGDSYAWNSTGVVADGARRTFTLDSANSTVTLVKGSTTEYSGVIGTTRTQTATVPLRLFGFTGTNATGAVTFVNPSSVRIYGVRIWDDGTLVRNYVPRVRNAREGLYDTVNSTFSDSDISGLAATGKYRLAAGGDIDYESTRGAVSADAYIESNGNNAIDTKYVLSLKTRLEADCSLLDFAGTQYLFGTGAGGGHNGLYHQLVSTRSLLMCIRNASGGSDWPWLANNINQEHVKVTIDFKAAKATMTSPWDSSANLSLPSGSLGDTANLWLMARNGGDYAKMRLYSFKIYEDDALVHYYAPCMKDGIVGVWDSCAGTFLANRSTADGSGFKLGGAGVEGSGMVFTTQPQGCRLSRGQTTTLVAFAPGAAGYQWLKDGEVVEGATGQTLEVAYGKGGTTNVYQCVSHYATFGYGVSDEAHVVNERSGMIISVR